jgi:hypothetical protein
MMEREDFADLTTYHDQVDEEDETEGEADAEQQEGETEGEADAEEQEALEELELSEEVGGKTEKVTVRGSKEAVERIKSGRMMQADYTRKTTELARQRDGMADAVRQAVDQGRSRYVQQLETLRQAVVSTIEPELRSVDWQTVAAEDPEKYLRLMARGQQMNAVLQQLDQQQRQQIETQAREDHANLMERIHASQDEVARTIPEWSDGFYSDMLSTVSQRYGFTLEEVGQLIDPRMIRAMADLTRLHKGSDKREIARKRIQTAPLPVTGGSPPATARGGSNTLMQRARKSGSMSDAAAALAARLNKR